MARSANKNPSYEDFSPEVIRGVFEATDRPGQSEKWAELKDSEASLASAALIKADQLRESNIDAGDAYLQAIADYHALVLREWLLKEIETTFDPHTLTAPSK